jgi:hypothetical protein
MASTDLNWVYTDASGQGHLEGTWTLQSLQSDSDNVVIGLSNRELAYHTDPLPFSRP